MELDSPQGQPDPHAAVATEPVFQLDVGDVLSTSADVITKNAVSLLGAAAVVGLPLLGFSTALPFLMGIDTTDPTSITANATAFGVIGVVSTVLTLVGTNLAQAAAIYISVEHLIGKRVGAADALRRTAQRLGPIILAAILVGVLTGLGTLLCILPGVIAAIVFSLTIPVVVVEQAGATDAMGRSRALTESYGSQIFVVLLVFGILNGVISFVAGLGVAAVAAVPEAGPILAFAGNWALQTVQFVLGAVAPAVMYTRLRGLREGVDVNQLAEVFA